MLFANGKKYGNVSNIIPVNNQIKLNKRSLTEMPSPVAERLLEEDVDEKVSKISKRSPHPLVDFDDERLFNDLIDIKNNPTLIQVFEILTLCHTTIATKDKSYGGKTKHFSTNPDELAFVSFGKFCGWEFLGKSESKKGMTVIRTEEEDVEYKVELIFPFSSKRKRMSVVIKNNSTGKYRLLTKGADEVIMNRSISCECFNKESL